MNKRLSFWSLRTLSALVTAALIFAFSLQGYAQTAAGTDIKNTASATYSDGTNSYSSVSNEVTVTVAKVAGLTITPDNDSSTNSAGSRVQGQTGVIYNFTVTNTGNFTNSVLVKKDAVQISSGGVVTNVEYSTNGGTSWTTWGTASGSGSTATWAAASTDLTVSSVAAAGTILFRVTARMETTATIGSQVTVTLGDAGGTTPFDSVAIPTGTAASANEVRTTDTTAANGLVEAKGVVSAVIASDAIPDVTLSAPTGPISAGSDITYTAQNCNTGARDLTSAFLLITVPTGTVFKPSSLGPSTAITPSVLYSTTDTAAASFSSTVPSPASNIKYVKVFLNPTTLLAGGVPSTGAGCVNLTWDVTVNSDFDADNLVSATVTLTGNNNLGNPVSDISGAGVGGTPTTTSVSKVSAILVGPNGTPAAVGTVDRDGDTDTDNNDDFQEKVYVPATPVAPGVAIGASGAVTFVNTLRNGGNATDTFRITAPFSPAGSTVEVCFNYNTTTLACNVAWTTVNSSTFATSPSVDNGTNLSFVTRITLPSTTTSGAIYPTTLTATSVFDNTKSNNTINDIVLGGAMKLEKTFVCNATINGTAQQSGSGDTLPSQYCVPGAVVTYTVKYTNISRTLTATNFVLVEDGDAGTNNWLATTDRVLASEFDYVGATGTTAGSGTINAYAADPSRVTDTVSSVAPGYIGRLVFKRTIK